MTRNEVIAKWNSMQPRERDAWVANSLPGYPVRMLNEVTRGAFKPEYDRLVLDLGNGRYNNIPRYSTHIEYAWNIVELMKSEFNICTYMLGEEGFEDGWTVKFKEHGFVMGMPSAPEAICLAALISVLTQGEGIER
ncbi:hypothetical protein WGM54_03535 [Paenibacillus polymyxa]|uniref:BC1872 family protein n=1 Tax=Paenibacillus polymyxa TaxID=1406 RepID=UPI00307F73FA